MTMIVDSIPNKPGTTYKYRCACCGDEFETNYAHTIYCKKPECKTPVNAPPRRARKAAISKTEAERNELHNKLTNLWGR